jgi:hypothetical protein
MAAVYSACVAFELPVLALVDDSTAIALAYASARPLAAGARHVLFVDVGATSVKAHAALFSTGGDFVRANATANLWSERTGAHFFARAVAARRGVSLHPAQKFRRSGGAVDAAALAGVGALVRAAAAAAAAAGGAVDEVQLIGGGANSAAYRAAVAAAAGGAPVRRDLRPQEAAAVGGLLTALAQRGVSPHAPLAFAKRPTASLNLTCTRTHAYCRRGVDCQAVINESSAGCRRAYIDADPADVPEGVDPRVVTIELTNASAYGAADAPVGQFELASPEARVEAVRWCGGGACAPVAFRQIGPPGGESPWIARRILERQRERRAGERAVAELAEALRALEPLLAGATEEQRRVAGKWARALREGELTGEKREEVGEVAAELAALKKELLLASQGPQAEGGPDQGL